MKKHRPTPPQFTMLLLVAVFCICLGVPVAMSQADMRYINTEELSPHSRPVPVFKHDEHNEKAKLDDCASCHHGKDDNGKQDRENYDPTSPCVECHAVNNSTTTPLKRAFHQQCIGCHVDMKAGPTYCGGCHRG